MHNKLKDFHEYVFMYSAGSVIYAGTEVAFRGFTHWTMVITGGICAALIHFENKKLRSKKLYLRCLAGCATITAAEYSVGCIVNRLLHWNVWDYSERFLNIQGQVCPLFTFFWFLLSVPAIYLSCLVSDRSENFTGGNNVPKKKEKTSV